MSVVVTHGNLFSQLNDLAAALRNNVSQAIKIATDAAYQDAKGTTLFKDKSGDMRASISESFDGLSGKVRRGRKKYFGFVANGTRPHRIEGGPLAFMMNGAMMFRRSVNHPGTAPRPFMQHAHDLGQRVLEEVGGRFVYSAVQRFNRAS